MQSVLLLRPYFNGKRLTIRTDHNSLRLILNVADATGRSSRWLLSQSEFDFDVKHCTHVKHQAVDAQLRLRTDGADNTPLEDDLPVLVIASGEEMDDTNTTIPALEAHKSAPAQTVTNFGGTGTAPLTLKEFIAAQSADGFRQNSAKSPFRLIENSHLTKTCAHHMRTS